MSRRVMNQSSEYELDIDEMEHYKRIMGKLNRIRNEKANYDFIISVGEKKIHVNKDIVRAGSDYFDAMFSHDTMEKQCGTVRMKDVEYFAVEKCVDFIYTGKLSVSIEQCDAVLFVANMMQLGEICDKIGLFLQTNVDIKRFFDIRKIALKFSLTPLQEFCDHFAISNVVALSKLEEFNDIDASYLKLLVSSNVSAKSGMQDAKLAVIVQWVNADQNDRTVALVELLKSIDFTKLTPQYCRYLVKEEPLCQVSLDLVRMLFLAVAPNDDDSCTKPMEMLSDETPLNNALIVFDKNVEQVMAYFPLEAYKRSIAKSPPSLLDDDFTACSAGNSLFVFQSDRSMFYLDFDDARWKCGPDLKSFHGDSLRCGIHYGCIYVGGANTLEKLNLSDLQEWKYIDLKGNICHSSAIVGYKKCIYLIGGTNENGDGTRTVVRKSPHTKWSPASSLHIEREDASAVVYEGNIYVCGGDDVEQPIRRFEIYSDVTNLWIILENSTILVIDDYISLHVVNNMILATDSDSIKCNSSNDNDWNNIGNFINSIDVYWLKTTCAYLPFDTLEHP